MLLSPLSITKKFFNKFRKKFISRKKFKIRFFKKFKNKIECFDVKKVNKLFFYRNVNHKIDLITKTKFLTKKIYDLFKNQIFVIKVSINNILKKDFIRLIFFYFATFVLIIKKFKKNFRICINYWTLNTFIIKNRNCFLLIKKIFAKLYAVKYYIKLNIIAIFNEIQIRKNDEKKTTFFIKYNLYKYVVIFFDFCNTFETFQFYINKVLRKYLNDFCTVYLNNILIYNNNKKKHIIYVRKILDKFKIVELYLNINKCEFYVNKIKYFDFIIIIEDIKINFEKIQIIATWKNFQNIKNV